MELPFASITVLYSASTKPEHLDFSLEHFSRPWVDESRLSLLFPPRGLAVLSKMRDLRFELTLGEAGLWAILCLERVKFFQREGVVCRESPVAQDQGELESGLNHLRTAWPPGWSTLLSLSLFTYKMQKMQILRLNASLYPILLPKTQSIIF